jgi:hypothetical protein
MRERWGPGTLRPHSVGVDGDGLAGTINAEIACIVDAISLGTDAPLPG